MEASAAASAEVPTAVAPTGAASAAAVLMAAASSAVPTGAASAAVLMAAEEEAGAGAPDSESIDITVLRCCDGS